MKRRAFLATIGASTAIPALATTLAALPVSSCGPSTIQSLRSAFDEVNRIATELTPDGYEYLGIYMLGEGAMLTAQKVDNSDDRQKFFVDHNQGWVAS